MKVLVPVDDLEPSRLDGYWVRLPGLSRLAHRLLVTTMV